MHILIIGTGYVGLTTGSFLPILGTRSPAWIPTAKKSRSCKLATHPFYEPHLDEMLAQVGGRMRFVSSMGGS